MMPGVMPGTVVFFDLETSGLDEDRHDIIQIAAVAIGPDWEELEAFEEKLAFDRDAADPEALELNCYNAEQWDAEERPAVEALRSFSSFLRRHLSVQLTSRRGQPYRVAKLAGHNVATFDFPRLRAAFRRHALFLPAAFMTLDTLQLASWWQVVLLSSGVRPPPNLKLSTLAAYFGHPIDGAHDALADVRASARVARQLLETFGRTG